MTDPQRWTDAGDYATLLEQSLARSGQDLPMPADQKDVLWGRILSAIPVPAPSPGSPTALDAAGPTAAMAAPTAFKILGVVVAMAGTGAVAHHAGWLASSQGELGTNTATIGRGSPDASEGTQSRSASTAVSANAASNAVAPTSESASNAVAPTSETQVAPASPQLEAPVASTLGALPRLEPRTAPLPSAASSGSFQSQLKLESQAVLAARGALRGGDSRGALQILQRAQQRFGSGALYEEREALTIEALARSGDQGQASKRARSFLSSHPRSPHAADVQRHVRP